MNTEREQAAGGSSYREQLVLHGLDLNAGMVDDVDRDLMSAKQSELDEAIKAHWIFDDATFKSTLDDMVKSVRAVHAAAGVHDDRSDTQIAARILESLELARCEKPVGVLGIARFMTRLLYGYGRLKMRAAFHEGGRGRHLRDQLQASS